MVFTGNWKVPTAMEKGSAAPSTTSEIHHGLMVSQAAGRFPQLWAKGDLNPLPFLFYFRVSLATGRSPQPWTKGALVLIFISVQHMKQELLWTSTKISFLTSSSWFPKWLFSQREQWKFINIHCSALRTYLHFPSFVCIKYQSINLEAASAHMSEVNFFMKNLLHLTLKTRLYFEGFFNCQF